MRKCDELLAHDRDLILDGDVTGMERMKLSEPLGGNNVRLGGFRIPLPGRESREIDDFLVAELG